MEYGSGRPLIDHIRARDGVMALRAVRLDARDRTGVWIPLGVPDRPGSVPTRVDDADRMT